MGTPYDEFLRLSKSMEDANIDKGPRMVAVSPYFAKKAEEYGVTPQILFDALMEAK